MNKKQKNKHYGETPLDGYEKELKEFLDKGEYKRLENFVEVRKILEEAAESYLELQESKKITIRLKKKDLIKVKAQAKRNNIPYQTLIGLLINKYTEGETRLTI